MAEVASENGHKQIFVARQPIYDAQENVIAYELLFRSTAYADAYEISAEMHDISTASMIADGFTLAFNRIDKRIKAFINFPMNLLLNDSAYALPQNICVIEILEDVPPTNDIVTAIKTLKRNGYKIALDNYIGQNTCDEILSLADIVKVNISAVGMERLPYVAKILSSMECQMLAERVEDLSAYQLAKGLGFTFFQGYYFSRPETVTGRKASASLTAKMRLIQALTKDDLDIRDVTRTLSVDPALCYRLFNFINSAAFSLRTKIQSIQQALTILGTQKLRQWLLAVVVSDIDGTAKVQEAVFTSLQRGRYLENMARLFHNMVYPAETLFLLGLFSKLDVLLGQPLGELMENIPLTKGVADALIGAPSPYREWLLLVEHIEHGEWDEVESFLKICDLDHKQSSALYAESIDWAHTLLGLQGSN